MSYPIRMREVSFILGTIASPSQLAQGGARVFNSMLTWPTFPFPLP